MAVPHRNTDKFTLSRDTGFCESICFEDVDDIVSAGLVHVFEIWNALRFWGLTVICGPDCLLNMNLLALSLNSSSMAFCLSPIV